MEDALSAVCLDPRGVGRRCRRGQESPWRSLDDASRAALLAALELAPTGFASERAYPELSPADAGIDVIRRFVSEAAERSEGAPRIAVVTASALDPFEPVEFYLSLFAAFGAEAEWWPLDAALARQIESGAGCERLEQARRHHLRLARRDQVYPRLAEQQVAACRNPDALAALPDKVQGVFFSGGDQWRLRQAFFAPDGSPLPWLQRMRAAHTEGRLVVGGTSAGAAVQSGAAMLSNGSPEAALTALGMAAPPPDPGCARAGDCPSGMHPESLSFWPAGGFGLANHAVVDTHFSERAREPRLLRLLDQTGARLGYGVDEGSALLLRGESGHITVEAIGQHGGWIFLHRPASTPAGLAAEVWYLGAGARMALSVEPDGTVHAAAEWALACAEGSAEGSAQQAPEDALQSGALRLAGASLGRCGHETLDLAAGSGRIRLQRMAQTRVEATGSRQSIGPLRMEYRAP